MTANCRLLTVDYRLVLRLDERGSKLSLAQQVQRVREKPLLCGRGRAGAGGRRSVFRSVVQRFGLRRWQAAP